MSTEELIENLFFGKFKESNDKDKIIELFKSKRIPPTTLMQIIRNVHLAEGYTEGIDEEMAKVSGIYDQLNPQIDQLTGKIL